MLILLTILCLTFPILYYVKILLKIGKSKQELEKSFDKAAASNENVF